MKKLLITAILFTAISLPRVIAQYEAPAAFGMPTEFFYNLSPYSHQEKSIEYVDGIKTYRTKTGQGERVIGDPFLNPEFEEGAIYFSDSTKLVDIDLRYNVFLDKMEIVFQEDTLGIQPSYRMIGLQIGDRLFMNSLMYDTWTRDFKYGYLELMVDGDIKLLRKYEKSYVFNSFATKYNGGGGDKNYHYVDKEKLYYKTGVASAIQLKKRKKKILEIFGEDAGKVEEYAAENNLRFKNEDDLEKIFEYYNSL